MTGSFPLVFAARGVSLVYPGQREPALDRISLDIPGGTVYAILGPNGSGKSTLLKLCLGALQPSSGTITYADRSIDDWPRGDFARRVGAVPQIEHVMFPMTVRELVAMGRYPHLGPWRAETRSDRRAIDAALERCEMVDLAGRAIGTLSGGERQRARVARALAQQPDTLVLDEPTAALDIHHEMGMFELLAELARDDGKTVVIATHNINLAARYATDVLLLDRGVLAAAGAPDQVIDAETIERVYRWPVAVVGHPGPGPDTGAPQVLPLGRKPKPGDQGPEDPATRL